ncbi:MAG: diguanylate cyclase [Spirochaetaceae bacterium]|nr:MAG: diguanylate cyclase [Spirochaetaceae bacterium]
MARQYDTGLWSRALILVASAVAVVALLLWIVWGLPRLPSIGVPVREIEFDVDTAPAITLSDAEREFLEWHGPITIAVDPDWEPYEWFDDDGAFRGIAADLIEVIFGRLGLEYRVVRTQSWAESLDRSRRGTVDLLAFLNRTPAREEWLTFTDPYFVDPSVLISHEGRDYIADLARLSGLSMALPIGTSTEEELRRRYPNIRIIVVDTEEEAIRMVADRAADLTLRSLTVAAYVIRTQGLFNLKIAGQLPEFANEFRMGVRADRPELRDILNRGIATITPQETQRIINRYVSIQTGTVADYALFLRVSAGFVAIVAIGLFWHLRLRRLHAKLQAREADLTRLSRQLESDIAVQKRLEEQLTRHAEHLRLIIDSVPAYIYAKDQDGRFLLVNRALADRWGVGPDEAVGTTDDDYGATGEQARAYRDADRAVIEAGQPLFIAEEAFTRQDGTTGWFQTTKVPYRDPTSGRPAVLGISLDITERKRTEQLIRRMAQHDGLTGLANRALFSEFLAHAMAAADRNSTRLAVLFIDLDGFKPVNDTHGHRVGDLVLQEVANRIRAALRASDSAGRLGGDEFVALVPDLGDSADIDDVLKVAQKIAASIRAPIFVDGVTATVSASIGIALYPDHGTDEETLLQMADAAMYAAKHLGRDGIEVFRPESS